MRRGTVGERPWGLTLASLAKSRHGGQLTLTADDGRLYCVAFEGGAIVGASSPFTSDSASRIALTAQLVSSTQVAAIARAVAASAGRDEVDVVAEAARLGDEQIERLRWRLLLQRTARTFSVDRGGYVFGEQITVATAPGIAIDVGPAIFLGVRMNLSQERLAADLRRLGTRFVLRGEVDGVRFGFTRHEEPILHALRIGTSLPDLEAKRRDLEPRLMQAVIYTLVAVGLCEGLPAPRTREQSPAPLLADEAVGEAADEAAGEAADDAELALARARTTTYDGPRAWARGDHPRTRTVSSVPPPVAPEAGLLATREVIARGIALVEAQADHFALLGLPRDAALDSIRAAYVALAAHLHPDKLPELDPDATRDAQRLFAHVNVAYGVLSDPPRRAGYLAALGREPAPASPPPPAEASPPAAAPRASREPGPAGPAPERSRRRR